MSYIIIGNATVAMATCDIDRKSLFPTAKSMVSTLRDQTHVDVVIDMDGMEIQFPVGNEELKKHRLLSILSRNIREVG